MQNSMTSNVTASLGESSWMCWLHPVHGTPAKYPLQVSQHEGLDGLRHVMDEAASGVRQLPWKHMKQESICMTPLGIQYQDADDGLSPCHSSEFHIPLEWSDVLYTDTQFRDSRERTPTQMLLLAPEVAKSDAHRPVWLLFGHFDSDGLGHFLQSLSRCGAIRWDLRETYDAVRPCGQGLHGTVFVGESKASPSSRTQGRKVAVKVTDSDEDRVRREVRFMFQTGEHPNIVSLLGVFGVEKADASFKRERYALVMELGSNGDLGALLARGVLPEFRGMEIMIGVMSALAFLHSQRIVHRDVKPENVVLHAEHRPMLVDFSIAASLDDPTALLRSSGSPGYAAPEIVEQRAHCEKVDVFGAGALWYTLMSGRLPFPGSSTKEILANSRRCDVELAMNSCPECNEPQMQSLLKGMLARNPSERPSALECFKSFWQLSEAARRTPASIESMVALAPLGLTPKLAVPERPAQGESTSGGSNVSDIASEAKSKALVEELSLSTSASNMMELVVQTFCLQRLHVCGTVLTVSAH